MGHLNTFLPRKGIDIRSLIREPEPVPAIAQAFPQKEEDRRRRIVLYQLRDYSKQTISVRDMGGKIFRLNGINFNPPIRF